MGLSLVLIDVCEDSGDVQVYYIATSRELKRLDSLALSPIFGNFNESLQGLLTLRAFRKQDQFTQRNHALLNKSNRCWWPIQVVNRSV